MEILKPILEDVFVVQISNIVIKYILPGYNIQNRIADVVTFHKRIYQVDKPIIRAQYYCGCIRAIYTDEYKDIKRLDEALTHDFECDSCTTRKDELEEKIRNLKRKIAQHTTAIQNISRMRKRVPEYLQYKSPDNKKEKKRKTTQKLRRSKRLKK